MGMAAIRELNDRLLLAGPSHVLVTISSQPKGVLQH
jgi:hypothetical protein